MTVRSRPWWGNPLLWLGVSAVSVLVGLFVLPQFFGGTFLFLPFVWIRRRPSAEVESLGVTRGTRQPSDPGDAHGDASRAGHGERQERRVGR